MPKSTRTLKLSAVLVVCSALEASGQSGPMPYELVTGATMRRACAFAANSGWNNKPANTRAKVLSDFCQLKAANWSTARIPSYYDVVMADSGKAVLESQIEGKDSTGYGKAAGGAAGVAGEAKAAFGGLPLPSEGTVLVGFTQFVVGRAKDEANTYIIRGFVGRLCSEKTGFTPPPGDPLYVDSLKRAAAKEAAKAILEQFREDSIGKFLPATCTLLATRKADELLGAGYGLPSWSVVQATLKQDLDALPDTLTGRLTRLGPIAFTKVDFDSMPAPLQRLVAVVGASRAGMTYLRTHDLSQSLREATNDMVFLVRTSWYTRVLDSVIDANKATPQKIASEVRSIQVDWRRIPAASQLIAAAATLGVFVPDKAGTVPADIDLTVEWGLKALAVDLMDRGWIDQELRRAVTDYLASAGIDVVATLPFEWQKLWDRVHPWADSAAAIVERASVDARAAKNDKAALRRVYVRFAMEAVPLMTAAIDTSKLMAPAARAVVTLASTVSEIPQLRADARYPEIIARLTSIVSAVAPSGRIEPLRRMTFPPALMRTVQFANDAAHAQTPDQFQAVLESYAAPRDAFLRKRTRAPKTLGVYGTLNTYVGGARGSEKAWSPTAPTPFKASYSGLAIPLGLEVGIKRWGTALGVLFQIADVGQVASWRSDQEATDPVETTPPGLTFASVYAPGYAVVWNLPRFPLALGYSDARAPQFRNLASGGTPEQPRSNVRRHTFFLAIDVPIFP